MSTKRNRFLLTFAVAFTYGVLLFFGIDKWQNPIVNNNSSSTTPSSFLLVEAIINPPGWTNNDDNLRLEIDKITLISPNELRSATKFCIRNITILEAFEEDGFSFFSTSITNDAHCVDLNSQSFNSTGRQVIDFDQTIIYVLKNGTTRFWYPYDSFSNSISTELTYTFLMDGEELDSGIIVPQLIAVGKDNSDWDISFSIDTFRSSGRESIEFIVIKFARPILFRFIFPILLSSMLLLILFLTLVDSVGEMLEASVAILFGIFSLRQLLIPVNADIRTSIDFIVPLLYLIFATVLIQHLTMALKPKDSSLNRQKIKKEDTNNDYSLPKQKGKSVPMASKLRWSFVGASLFIFAYLFTKRN